MAAILKNCRHLEFVSGTRTILKEYGIFVEIK